MESLTSFTLFLLFSFLQTYLVQGVNNKFTAPAPTWSKQFKVNAPFNIIASQDSLFAVACGYNDTTYTASVLHIAPLESNGNDTACKMDLMAYSCATNLEPVSLGNGKIIVSLDQAFLIVDPRKCTNVTIEHAMGITQITVLAFKDTFDFMTVQTVPPFKNYDAVIVRYDENGRWYDTISNSSFYKWLWDTYDGYFTFKNKPGVFFVRSSEQTNEGSKLTVHAMNETNWEPIKNYTFDHSIGVSSTAHNGFGLCSRKSSGRSQCKFMDLNFKELSSRTYEDNDDFQQEPLAIHNLPDGGTIIVTAKISKYSQYADINIEPSREGVTGTEKYFITNTDWTDINQVYIQEKGTNDYCVILVRRSLLDAYCFSL